MNALPSSPTSSGAAGDDAREPELPETRKLAAELFPEISHPGLLRGISGVVRHAAELAHRHRALCAERDPQVKPAEISTEVWAGEDQAWMLKVVRTLGIRGKMAESHSRHWHAVGSFLAGEAGGRLAALAELDPDRVTPSVDLLQQVLALKGSLPESRLATLRPLVKRLIDALVKKLATRVQPALTGLTTPRPTWRRTGDLDLGRTVRANLHRVVEDDRGVDSETGESIGRRVIVPERLVFRSRARRSLDWHLVLVVDVSGSMEPSVIYSAMMSAIFAGLPALSVDFLAFSTRLIDFTDRVDDPLALLMEVQVGGGTRIGLGLRAARQRLSNPSRSLVVLVSDFEEGVSVGELLGEVRALAATGARLLGVASLNDAGRPRYHRAIAESVAAAGMPVAAVGPEALARWVAEQVR